MSYYYKYTFTSPESIYSLVKEEFKSYFDTGAVDDLLFPTYLDKCLKKLGRSSYIISEDVIEIDNGEYKIIGYSDLETKFIDDREISSNKEIEM